MSGKSFKKFHSPIEAVLMMSYPPRVMVLPGVVSGVRQATVSLVIEVLF